MMEARSLRRIAKTLLGKAQESLIAGAQPCVSCGKIMSGATGNGAPVEGAVSVCAYCANVAIFDADLKLQAFNYRMLPQETQDLIDQLRAIVLARLS